MVALGLVHRLFVLLTVCAAVSPCHSAASADGTSSGFLRGSNGRDLAAVAAAEDTVRDLPVDTVQDKLGLGVKPDKLNIASSVPIPDNVEDLGVITLDPSAVKEPQNGAPHRRLAGPVDLNSAGSNFWYPTWCCGSITKLYVRNNGSSTASIQIADFTGIRGQHTCPVGITCSATLNYWGFTVNVINFNGVPITTWTV